MSIHIAGDDEQHAMCGEPVDPLDRSNATAQPADSTCEDCFQAALEEMGDAGYLSNPEGRKQ